jgi:hypothetical protein
MPMRRGARLDTRWATGACGVSDSLQTTKETLWIKPPAKRKLRAGGVPDGGKRMKIELLLWKL